MPARIFPHFSPQEFQFFRIAPSRFSESEHRQAESHFCFHFAKRDGERGGRGGRERDAAPPRFSTSFPRTIGPQDEGVYDLFDFLYEHLAPFNSLTTAGCLPFLIPLLSLLFLLPSFPVTAFISSRHRRVVTGYSAIGNTYLRSGSRPYAGYTIVSNFNF